MGVPTAFAFDLWPWATEVAIAAGAVAAALVVLAVHRLRRPKAGSSPGAPARRGRGGSPRGLASDRRHATRRLGEPVAVLVGDAEGRAEPWAGSVVDRSPTGLCVAVAQDVAVGTLLTVRPRAAPPGLAPVVVGVANSRQEGGRYLLGCRFIQIPPREVLLFFG
jgi:hypothetical protein